LGSTQEVRYPRTNPVLKPELRWSHPAGAIGFNGLMSFAETGRNWSGNYSYRARRIHHPRTVSELQELVVSAGRLRALGTRHSFTAIADSDELVSLAELEGEVEVDAAAETVSVPGEVTYAQLAGVLASAGRALHNLASLPHISVIGAVSTATHGSGDENGNLATAVAELELVTGTGELVRRRRGEPGFEGIVVGLGALGVVTRVTLDTQPHYEVSQRVFEDLEWETLYEHFDEITARGESVSVFHRFGERAEQVWVKTRVGDPDLPAGDEDLFGARPADAPRNPVLGGDPANCTDQLGVSGPWAERLPHFRSGFTPSSGEEIQSEYFVARENAVPALEALRLAGPQLRPLMLAGEIRTMAADELWLSPQYQETTVGFHFTWRREEEDVERALGAIETALEPFSARPHWAKLFLARAEQIAPQYERLEDFRRLREELDPRGVFTNRWLRERLLGNA
jgi:xylitol oxidase